MDKADKIFMGVFLILALAMGSLLTLGYQDIRNKRTINGLYLYNSDNSINYQTARETAKGFDKKGDWVCINVAYDMSPELAFQTCVHECGHKAYSEIFAEACEKDFTKCLGWLNEE